jgi:hypothetical protein
VLNGAYQGTQYRERPCEPLGKCWLRNWVEKNVPPTEAALVLGIYFPRSLLDLVS